MKQTQQEAMPATAAATAVHSVDSLARQTQFRNLALGFVDSLLIRCAVELGIPDAVHRHGGPITFSELSAALAVPQKKSVGFRRIMRALSCIGCIDAIRLDGEAEDAYGPTAFSALLVTDDVTNQAPFVRMGTEKVLLSAFQSLGAWVRDGETSTPAFQMANGRSFWDLLGEDDAMNKMFNDAMAVDSSSVMSVVVKKCAHVFEGIATLVDVGGGTGAAALAIAEAFPGIKCTVLDLPHVVANAMGNQRVDFVPGDMFSYIPRGNAILLKWILHDWNDEDCVKILQRCKEAIPSKEEGGKVIIVEMVVDPKISQQQSSKAQVYMDMLMLVRFDGKERGEHEWRNIFVKAGFSDYKITPATDTRSIIELYP